ncbi:hypothetical protein KNT64_gp068 [Pseudomonas phage PspYZU05]|uniref:Uncharacterized protein n=1 Tax=Pseudomonas phage PspYZU05 TaxID=1983556 RepID=A0A2U7N2F1_9CAUD|nr:hypothetical protein KNT64_gp068 [Pseudomonas phage PspYZU05]ASD52020.1 hypothetical protein PspYZU05_68 [Pseudomonas phage PspYZU05]
MQKTNKKMYRIKSPYNEFILLRMSFDEMVNEFGLNKTNDIISDIDPHYYIDAEYYQMQGAV